MLPQQVVHWAAATEGLCGQLEPKGQRSYERIDIQKAPILAAPDHIGKEAARYHAGCIAAPLACSLIRDCCQIKRDAAAKHCRGVASECHKCRTSERRHLPAGHTYVKECSLHISVAMD